MRKPFQGVFNIVRFNWHFYIAILLVMVLFWWWSESTEHHFLSLFLDLLILGGAASTLISLLASWYIYDYSGLYNLTWLSTENPTKIVNVHAGFDETSTLIQQKNPAVNLVVFDFYDPAKHTEVSIERARRAYPVFEGTEKITSAKIPLPDQSQDLVLLLLAAHEIREESERIQFFKEAQRILNPNGKILVLEHLRDLPNFLAFNIGFFHFHSKASWLHTFEQAGLKVSHEKKVTSFLHYFQLSKHGNAS